MGNHRRDRSPVKAMWAVAGTAALALGAAATASFASTGPHGHGFGHGDHPGLHALTRNPDCTLTVPKNPLSAQGLATPYVLRSAGLTCSEHDEATAAFVQATILAPDGTITVYNPTVINPGDQVTPPPVTLPKGAVVTVWTGFNSNVLKLVGPGHRAFVNFAQQSYANSPQWFAAAARAGVTAPSLGTSPVDHQACPSVRDFSVVDQDQSDNVPVAYSAYNVTNGSDDNLITYIDKALGCTQFLWQVPNQTDGTMSTSGPLEELQAQQTKVQALVPSLDPFVTRNGQPDLALQNLYRLQVGQPLSPGGNDTPAYCQNLASIGAPRLMGDAQYETDAAPQFTDPNQTLAAVLKGRFEATWKNLQCTGTAPY